MAEPLKGKVRVIDLGDLEDKELLEIAEDIHGWKFLYVCSTKSIRSAVEWLIGELWKDKRSFTGHKQKTSLALDFVEELIIEAFEDVKKEVKEDDP